jgi:hydroxypyruvate reductase 1
MTETEWQIHNPAGSRRVIVTKQLPGERWLDILAAADCRVEVCTCSHALGAGEIVAAIGERCDAAIGQLTEPWSGALLAVLKKAGGRVYSNYAVGFDNVDVQAATALGLPVGNTPGVLTEATAELAVALTFAGARRIVESSRFLSAGNYRGWLPSLFLGKRLGRKTLGVVGAGRIGAAYARMLVEGQKMNLVYYDKYANDQLEAFVGAYGAFLAARGEQPVTCRRAGSLAELLAVADVVSLHIVLDEGTAHLIDAERLAQMKATAILVNTSRGPLIDEEALVAHCRAHPEFTAALDVFEHEPRLTPGLNELANIVAVPHLGSATGWTRSGMATLAAANVAAVLAGWPVWASTDVSSFLSPEPPRAAPSIVNADALGLAQFTASPAG